MRLRVLGAGLAVSALAGGLATASSAPAAAATRLPAVTRIAPASGSTRGGTRLVVTGRNFTHVTAVKFGKSAGKSVSVTSPRRLLVTAPAHAAGPVWVRVSTSHGTSPAVKASRYTYVAPPGPVTAAGVTAVTTTTVSIQWTNPPGGGFAGVVIRRARGRTAPSFTSGTLVARTARAVTGITDKALAAGARYTYALFARGAAGSHAAPDVLRAATSPPLKVTATALPPGTAGMTYQGALTASGGTPPYAWQASGLPPGLSLAADGVITGFPEATGTHRVTVRVTDARHATRTATLALAVQSALPSGCAGKACAKLSPDGKTVQVPASDISGVTRAGSGGAVSQVTLAGLTVATGDVLVLAPGGDLPSGLIAVAGTITSNGGGSSTVAVTPATPADAYDRGTVQALPAAASAGTTVLPGTRGGGARGGPAVAGPPGDGPLECTSADGSQPTLRWDLAGLSVTHKLTPALAAIWKHPYFGSGGIYGGTGGLSLFQFDLDGTITLNMGIAVSGAATCTLDLPETETDVPAGYLGAIIFQARPTLTFTTSGKIDDRATVTLSCGVEYRWSSGHQSRVSYCLPSATPLRLSADSGLQASLKASLDASITLDDIAGITGDIRARLHGSYYPGQHPVAELDASAGFDLGACLACFWDGSPARVTLVSGTIFSKTLATYDTAPAPVPPVITSTTLPPAIAGTPYTAGLTTADQRKGTWKVIAGSLPPGLSLAGAAISGTPAAAGTYTFTLSFTDTRAETVTAAVRLTVVSGGPATWTAAQAPVPADAGSYSPDPSITSVSCGSPGSCAAIGQYTAGPGVTGPMLLTLSGGSWTAAQTPVPAGATRYDLEVNSVSCASSSFCVAVGRYGDPGDTGGGPWTGLLLTWHGGNWSASPAPLPGDAASPSFTNVESVSCPSASYCVAAGYYSDSNYLGEGLVLTWSGGSWTAEQAPLPGNVVGPGVDLDHAGVNAVSCASASSCTAVGYYSDASEHEQGLLLTMSGGSWSPEEAPLPAGATSGDPGVDAGQVWCSPASFCLAASQYQDSSGNTDSELLTLSGGSWTAEQAPVPAGGSAADPASISGMSCASSSSCFAVGGYTGASAGEGLLLTWSDGTWTPARAPLPSSASGGDLSGISCPSASYCAASGGYGPDPGGYPGGMLLTWSDGTWTAARAPLPGNASQGYAGVNGISCPSPVSCVAVGVYQIPGETSTLQAGLLLTMSG